MSSGRSSRRKGHAYQREVAQAFRAVGLQVDQLQRNEFGNADLIVAQRFYVETKRQERLRVPEWLEQTVKATPERMTPMLVFRQSHGRSWVVLPIGEASIILMAATTEGW